MQVGDDKRRAADLRGGGGDRFAGQDFVDAGDESRFAVFDVFGVEREAEQRLEIELFPRGGGVSSATRSSANGAFWPVRCAYW